MLGVKLCFKEVKIVKDDVIKKGLNFRNSLNFVHVFNIFSMSTQLLDLNNKNSI